MWAGSRELEDGSYQVIKSKICFPPILKPNYFRCDAFYYMSNSNFLPPSSSFLSTYSKGLLRVPAYLIRPVRWGYSQAHLPAL